MGTQYFLSQGGTLWHHYFYKIYFTNSNQYLPRDSYKKDDVFESPLPHAAGEFETTFIIGSGFRTEKEEKAWELDEDNYMLWSPEEKKRLLCPIDSQHDKKWTRTLRECISVRDSRTDAQRAERHPAFALMQVPSMGNDGEKIIPQRLADRMESSGLKGARYKPVKAVSFYEGSGFRPNIKSTTTPGYDTDLVSLIFTGSSCLREWEFRGGANACPFCGFKPLVCESCGYIPDDCPQCDEYPFKANAAGIQGIELVTGRMSRPIVEGDRWDGSDLICGRNRARDLVVTRRFVEWLLAIDAAPFVATPLPVCVDRMTADQIRNLAKAQDVHSLLM